MTTNGIWIRKNGLSGPKLNQSILLIIDSHMVRLWYQHLIPLECNSWRDFCSQIRSTSCVQDQLVQAKLSIFKSCLQLRCQKSINIFQSPSPLRLLQIKLKRPLTKSLKKEEKVFMAHQQVRDSSSSLMIWVCHKKVLMVLSLQLSYWDNGWTTKDGMISMFQLETSENWYLWDLLQQWVHQETLEIPFQIDRQDISRYFT